VATVRVPVVVCDVCAEERATRRWKVTFPDEGTASLDLCKEHEKPLLELKQMARARPGAKGPRRRVVQPEQVKRARKKPATVRKQASTRRK
jgi:hypothetical protein